MNILRYINYLVIKCIQGYIKHGSMVQLYYVSLKVKYLDVISSTKSKYYRHKQQTRNSLTLNSFYTFNMDITTHFSTVKAVTQRHTYSDTEMLTRLILHFTDYNCIPYKHYKYFTVYVNNVSPENSNAAIINDNRFH